MICRPEAAADMFRRAAAVQVLAFDIDGVFANGQIGFTSAPAEIKFFDAHDGFAIKLAHACGIRTAVISARESTTIRQRAAQLRIQSLYLERYDKLNAYCELRSELAVTDPAVCFVGDDIADIPVLRQVGFPVAVANAAREVSEVAGMQTRRAGGYGAIREVLEFILYAQHRLDSSMQAMLVELTA